MLFLGYCLLVEFSVFSPTNLVFAHAPLGPLDILNDQFLSDSPAKHIFSYASNFHSCLHRAHELMSLVQMRTHCN